MITPVKRIMILKTDPPFRYRTEDGLLWDTMTKAVDHEAKLEGREDDNPVTHADYENVFTIQEAINMAVAEDRVVRFLWSGSNEEVRRQIDDLKGCKLMKPSKESKDIAVIPPSVKNFDFHEVK